jgi:hypothetical protein
MKHPELQWNPASKEWFCVRCFKTSDHLCREDAQVELNQSECGTDNCSKPNAWSIN